jgi:hypothetical protein
MDKVEHAMEHDPDEVIPTILAVMVDGDGLTPQSLLATIKDMLVRFAKRKDKRPYCPYCHELMVEAKIETDDGWTHCWLCGCPPTSYC